MELMMEHVMIKPTKYSLVIASEALDASPSKKQTVTDIDFDATIDLLVVGAGISGLIAAREFLRIHKEKIAQGEHSKPVHVRILEARDRIGGQMYTADVPLGMDGYNNTATIGRVELGADWFDPSVHENVKKELEAYKLEYTKVDDEVFQTKYHWFFEDLYEKKNKGVNMFSSKKLLETLNAIPLYSKILDVIDRDSKCIIFEQGYRQNIAQNDIARMYYDMSVPLYIERSMADVIHSCPTDYKHSKAFQAHTLLVREYLCAQVYTLTGVYPSIDKSSAMSLLYLIKGWGGTKNAFNRYCAS